MSEMTLPEVLVQLAALIPARVRLGHLFRDGVQDISIFDDSWVDMGGWLQVYSIDPNLKAGGIQWDRSWRDTREALEQEIQARGWFLEQFSVNGRHDATISRAYDPADPDSDCRLSGDIRTGGYDTPAHALGLALLAALSDSDK